MAGIGDQSPDDVLRGLFGNLVASAQAGLNTADVWAQLRASAQSWAEGVLSTTLGRTPTDDEVNASASQLLRGVSATDVSRWRGIAGKAVTAHNNLLALNEGDQITGSAVFTPPWSVSANNVGLPETYRVRIQWDIEFRGFNTISRTEWATYDLNGPLTNVQDVISQAMAGFSAAEYNNRATVTNVRDYVVETV